jgi:hypothetical protein
MSQRLISDPTFGGALGVQEAGDVQAMEDEYRRKAEAMEKAIDRLNSERERWFKLYLKAKTALHKVKMATEDWENE